MIVPGRSSEVAGVRVERETEIDRGWSFEVVVSWAKGGGETRHQVSLSWADYEHWAGGRFPPEKVAKVVVEQLAAGCGADAVRERAKLDCSTARRLVEHFDVLVRAGLGEVG